MGKFHHFLTELSAGDTSGFGFQTITSVNVNVFLTKLPMCIDIIEVCFGNANGQILSTFDKVICPGYDSGGVLSFHIFIYKGDTFLLLLFASLYNKLSSGKGLQGEQILFF